MITRQAQIHMFLLLGILVFQYALGMFLTSRFARLVIPAEPAQPEAAAETAGESGS